MNKARVFSYIFLFFLQTGFSQTNTNASGSLFIIGGGKRSPELMQTMLQTASLKQNDYIVVLPMASSQTDTAYYYFKKSIDKLTALPVVNFNFNRASSNQKTRLDSLKKAKLIFIAGGDQSRFMEVVLQTPVWDAIHEAYKNGATIAGTSAGAAVMSRYMITGKELLGDTTYHATFRKIWKNNIEFQEGLGLLPKAIIDQHFIARSRYNRLFSALAAFPEFPCIGIDEATAIIVKGDKATVTGESQVIVLKQPKNLQTTEKGLIKLNDVHLSIYTEGDVFDLR